MLTTADLIAHTHYHLRATIVTGYACWLAFLIGYFIPDSVECA